MSIAYTDEKALAAEEFIGVLVRSTLARRRPVADPARIQAMIDNADIVLCARDGKKLVGVARALTDFSYCCYLSDLAVDADYQRRGIGRDLIRRTREIAGMNASLILVSAPGAVSYYEGIGMTPIASGWKFDRAG